jgi:hypothetical protein
MMTAPTQPLSSEDMKFERAGPMPRDTARWRNGLGAIALALCALALLTPISRIAVQGRVGLLLAPGFATLGDLAIALLIAFVVVPFSVLWRRLTRAPERWAWHWCLEAPEQTRGWGRRTVGAQE